MTHLRILLSLVFRTDAQYGFIGVSLAWRASGILAEHADDWTRLT